jgi:hypothetical protein
MYGFEPGSLSFVDKRLATKFVVVARNYFSWIDRPSEPRAPSC